MAGYSPRICPGTSYTQREIDYVYDLKVYYVITIIYIRNTSVERSCKLMVCRELSGALVAVMDVTASEDHAIPMTALSHLEAVNQNALSGCSRCRSVWGLGLFQ